MPLMPARPRDAALIDLRTKGIPGGTVPFAIEDIDTQNWNVLDEDMPLPLAILKDSNLRHNNLWMQKFLQASGAMIAPHGKTTMSPELFDMQLDAGAWGITLATPHQVQVARSFGHKRILLANQLVGKAAIRYVVNELNADPDFEFYCLVDSSANVDKLAAAVRDAGSQRPMTVMVERGYLGGRTGCRTHEQAMEVARAVKATQGALVLAGIECFEGLIHSFDPKEYRRKVSAILDDTVALARQCEAEGLFGTDRIILSAGGSQYYDIVADAFANAGLATPTQVILRSGCYLTHDSVLYTFAFEQLRDRNPELAAMDGGLKNAIEVWAYVQSRPEPGKAIVAFGKRDASHDQLPVLLSWYRPESDMTGPEPLREGHKVTGMNDQHCHMEIPESSPLAVGDMVAFGISHPCLTFDKWRTLFVVDDGYRVTSAVRTYF